LRTNENGKNLNTEHRTPDPLNLGPTVYQCVPNFSEGRDRSVVEAIAEAIRRASGALLIDYSADGDHNRCVMTILGPGEAIFEAVVNAARVAVARIDLRTHTGVHPRIGAIDVVPVVPIRGVSSVQAGIVAEKIGGALAEELRLPVYFYEGNTLPGKANALPELRRGGFEALREIELSGDRAPDLGPNRAHLTAGVTVVGARGPLVAYNVNLGTPDVTVARAIARRIREERPRLPELEGVRALGLFLASQGRAQVSLNLTRPDQTPLPEVFAFIAREAAWHGVTDLESEIIGAISSASLGGQPPEAIHWTGYNPNQILETWLFN
jgi:glutamate formiminotransferase